MFDAIEVGGTKRRFWSLIGSLALQVGLIGGGILLPFVTVERLAVARASVVVIAPPPPPPPPSSARVEVRRQRPVPKKFNPNVLTAPGRIPKDVPKIIDEELPQEIATNLRNGVPGGVPGGVDGGVLTGVLVGISQQAPPPQPPSVRPVQKEPEAPQRVKLGGRVLAAKLVRQVMPVYPQLAKSARIQGVVQLAAVIGRDGSVLNLTLVSGPPLLVKAALEAVQNWRYQPTLLNGEPVEVLTTIDVNFRLN